MAALAPSARDILDTIGATPIVQLRQTGQAGARIHVKLEHLSPTGSAADRLARGIVADAIASGELAPGATVVEATLGNTGISLAQVCTLSGHPVVACMPESMSLERRALLRAWGARVVLTPADEHLDGARARAQQEASAIPGAWVLPQWDLARSARVHEAGTGAELVEQVLADGGRIDAFVAPVGTGATLTGIGAALRRQFPNVKMVAVLPSSDGPHRIQGCARREEGLVPARASADRIIDVTDREAWDAKAQLGREDGLLVGMSTGACVVAARRVADELGSEARVYTLCWDTGERYFSLAERFR